MTFEDAANQTFNLRPFARPKMIISSKQKQKEFVMPESMNDRLRMHHRTVVIYFGDIDSTAQTWKCRFEVWTTRELSKAEIVKYKENPSEFEPDMICNIFPVGCAEVLERELMEFNNYKTFTIQNDTKHYKTLTLKRAWLISCVFVENLELENFPFDVQHFEMLIQV